MPQGGTVSSRSSGGRIGRRPAGDPDVVEPTASPPPSPSDPRAAPTVRAPHLAVGNPVADPMPAGPADPMPAGPAGSARGRRRARLQLSHLDPWTTLKFSLVLAVAFFVIWMVAVGALYAVLDQLDVFAKLNKTINEVNDSTSELVTPKIVFGAAAVIGAINIVLFTALATIGSFIYNLCADMVGGIEVTLAEGD